MSSKHAELQREVKNYLEQNGHIVIVTKHGKMSRYYRRPESEKGMLDLLVLSPACHVDSQLYELSWIEIKTGDDILKKDQIEFMAKQHDIGNECYEIRSLEECKIIYEV